MSIFGVAYRITSLETRKAYIGITTQFDGYIEGNAKTLPRWSQHCNWSSNKRMAIGRAIAKRGPENFVIEVVASAVSDENLNALEVLLISQEQTLSPHGYNLTGGGDMKILAEESRARLSAALKGKKRTAEQRAKISASKKGKTPWLGRKHKPETIEKMHKPKSPEHRHAMSIVRLGKPSSGKGIPRDTHWLGRKHKPETIEKMRKPKSPEAIENIRIAALARHAKKRLAA